MLDPRHDDRPPQHPPHRQRRAAATSTGASRSASSLLAARASRSTASPAGSSSLLFAIGFEAMRFGRHPAASARRPASCSATTVRARRFKPHRWDWSWPTRLRPWWWVLLTKLPAPLLLAVNLLLFAGALAGLLVVWALVLGIALPVQRHAHVALVPAPPSRRELMAPTRVSEQRPGRARPGAARAAPPRAGARAPRPRARRRARQRRTCTASSPGPGWSSTTTPGALEAADAAVATGPRRNGRTGCARSR